MAKKIMGSAKASRRKSRKKASAIQARRKKEFMFRGYNMEQLRAMPFDEVLELLPSRSRRTYLLVCDKLNGECDEVVRTHRRDLPILPAFVGKTVAIYNGKEFVEVELKPEMIGCFLGEFVQNRKAPEHSGPGVGATRSSKFMPLK